MPLHAASREASIAQPWKHSKQPLCYCYLLSYVLFLYCSVFRPLSLSQSSCSAAFCRCMLMDGLTNVSKRTRREAKPLAFISMVIVSSASRLTQFLQETLIKTAEGKVFGDEDHFVYRYIYFTKSIYSIIFIDGSITSTTEPDISARMKRISKLMNELNRNYPAMRAQFLHSERAFINNPNDRIKMRFQSHDNCFHRKSVRTCVTVIVDFSSTPQFRRNK